MTERFFQLLPDQASTMAARVDALYFFMVAVSAFFSILIALALVVLAVRFRRRQVAEEPPAAREGVQPATADQETLGSHGTEGVNLVLEITWTVVPLALTMVMFVWGAVLFFELSRIPPGAMEISIVGKQWMWKFQHPEGRWEVNELHVPVGRPVKLTMASEDVIHSFYVPAFRVKADVLPGRYRTAWFEATRTGRYHIFCAEYCGTQHSGMIGWVSVMEPEDYQAWLAGGPAGESAVQRGERLFGSLGCATCHLRAGGRGPALDDLYGSTVALASGQKVVADEAYLRESILTPAAKMTAGFEPIMPVFKGMVSEEQVFQLIAYLKSLKNLGKQEGTPDGNAQNPG